MSRLVGHRFDHVAWAVGCSLLLLLVTGPFAATMAASPAPLCEAYAGLPEDDGPHSGMAWIEGGRFTMGDDDERPEEQAAHEVVVDGFWIDRRADAVWLSGGGSGGFAATGRGSVVAGISAMDGE